MYCSLKKSQYITYISVPPTYILPIYRLNIISETLVSSRFRKHSISGVYCSLKIVDISPIYPSFTYISFPQTDILPIYCPQVSFWSPYTKYFAGCSMSQYAQCPRMLNVPGCSMSGMLNVWMLNVHECSVSEGAQCPDAQCPYAKCPGAQCPGAECPWAVVITFTKIY